MYAPQGHPAVYFSVLASSLIVKNSLSECMSTVINSHNEHRILHPNIRNKQEKPAGPLRSRRFHFPEPLTDASKQFPCGGRPEALYVFLCYISSSSALNTGRLRRIISGETQVQMRKYSSTPKSPPGTISRFFSFAFSEKACASPPGALMNI